MVDAAREAIQSLNQDRMNALLDTQCAIAERLAVDTGIRTSLKTTNRPP